MTHEVSYRGCWSWESSRHSIRLQHLLHFHTYLLWSDWNHFKTIFCEVFTADCRVLVWTLPLIPYPLDHAFLSLASVGNLRVSHPSLEYWSIHKQCNSYPLFRQLLVTTIPCGHMNPYTCVIMRPRPQQEVNFQCVFTKKKGAILMLVLSCDANCLEPNLCIILESVWWFLEKEKNLSSSTL